MEKLCAMLKMIRLSSRMRVDFKKIQVLLEVREHKTKSILGLDLKNRWNIMFTMIDSSYSTTENFQSLSKIFEHYSTIVTLISIEWRVLKCFKDFLAHVYEIIFISNLRYATLSNQSFVYESLKTPCE